MKLFQTNPKIAIIFAIIAAVIILTPVASYRHVTPPEDVQYGVTFSYRAVEDMGLNWQKAYGAMLDDLRARRLRIPVYWDDVEPKKGIVYYDAVDWQIDEAAKRNAQVILVIGQRVPRWPECHLPDWARMADTATRENALLAHVRRTVERYKDSPTVTTWQVENEPFLPLFGECPKIDPELLDREIALVHKLDPSRPIMTTDSGELSLWYQVARRADVFGTSLYLKTYSRELQHYITYPHWAWLYRLKRNIVEAFIHPNPPMIISELQAEPWGPKPYYELTKVERERTMSIDDFHAIVSFARQTGFDTMYLWGVEYWYWEKEVNNQPAFWDYAKTLF